jgi:outer membrane immunogenic protein
LIAKAEIHVGVVMKVMRQLGRLAAGTAVAAIAAFAGVGFAQADGMPGKRVVYEKPWNWSGLYFGAQAGWAWADVDSQITVSPLAGNDGVGFDSVRTDAPIAGGQIGIQHQFGQFVLGVEASGVFTYNDDFSNVVCPNPAITCGKRLDDILSVGPRLGWAMGKWMPYVTGGYANASVSHKSFITGANTGVFLGRERFEGWYLGAGVDMALAHGWTVGLEYRHYEFEDQTMLTFIPAGLLTGDIRSIDTTVDTIALRVSWKLGWADRSSPLK